MKEKKKGENGGMSEIYIRTIDLPKWLVDLHFNDKDLISISDLIEVLEDASDDLNHYKELYEDLQQDLYDNYKFVGQDYYEEQ